MKYWGFFRVVFPQCPTALNKNSAAFCKLLPEFGENVHCHELSFTHRTGLGITPHFPHGTQGGCPYPKILQNNHNLLRNQDSRTGGDRNGRQMQFFSPSFLSLFQSLTVPGRCTGNMAQNHRVSSASCIFVLFGEMSSYRI